MKLLNMKQIWLLKSDITGNPIYWDKYAKNKGEKTAWLKKKDVATCNEMTCMSVFFLPSCRSWWAGRALPRRCILSLFPHPFFPQAWKNPSQLHNNFFLPPPWRERNKNFQQSVEKLQKKNQLRLLFNIGSGVTTPRGQSPLFKKKNCLKTAVEKEEGGNTHESNPRY